MFYLLLYECKVKNIQMKKLTKEQQKVFYDWLEQFIKDKGYENYNPTDRGDYFVFTNDGQYFYQGTYEWNNWLDKKFEEFNEIHNF